MAAVSFEEKLNRYICKVKENLDPELVILFGSYARGEADKYSDIDLAIFIEGEPEIKYLEEETLLYKLRRSIDLRIEPHLFYFKDYHNHEPADFIGEVIRTGKIIYRKPTGAI